MQNQTGFQNVIEPTTVVVVVGSVLFEPMEVQKKKKTF